MEMLAGSTATELAASASDTVRQAETARSYELYTRIGAKRRAPTGGRELLFQENFRRVADAPTFHDAFDVVDETLRAHGFNAPRFLFWPVRFVGAADLLYVYSREDRREREAYVAEKRVNDDSEVLALWKARRAGKPAPPIETTPRSRALFAGPVSLSVSCLVAETSDDAPRGDDAWDERFHACAQDLEPLLMTVHYDVSKRELLQNGQAPSKAEINCLRELVAGRRPEEIARVRKRSKHTIYNQLRKLEQRLGAASRDEAVAIAVALGLLD